MNEKKEEINPENIITLSDEDKDRIKEYTKKIPRIGLDEFVDSGQYESSKFAKKISTFSHYTSSVLKIIKF